MCASAQEPWANIAELRLRNSVINYLYPKRLLWTVITLSIHHQITNGASLNICYNWSPWSTWKQNGSHESWKRFNIVGGKSLIYKTGWKCKKNWCGGNWLWEMEQNLCYLWNLSFGKKLFSRVLWKSIYQKSSDCGNRFLYSRPHGCQIWSFSYSLNFRFLIFIHIWGKILLIHFFLKWIPRLIWNVLEIKSKHSNIDLEVLLSVAGGVTIQSSI